MRRIDNDSSVAKTTQAELNVSIIGNSIIQLPINSVELLAKPFNDSKCMYYLRIIFIDIAYSF